MPRLLIPALGLTMAGFGVATASAQTDPVITIPIDTVVFAEPDTFTVVATTSVDPALVGTTCALVVEADNNSSVHPGNDLLVQSGGDTVVLADVEGDEGRITFGSGPLTLGPVITVTLRMGEDGVFSAGFSVECRATPPTSTTTAPPVSSTSTSTSVPDATSSTTTSVSPPVSISTTSAPATTVPPPTVSPSTTAPPVTVSTTATRVLPRVQEAPPAVGDEGSPSFVG